MTSRFSDSNLDWEKFGEIGINFVENDFTLKATTHIFKSKYLSQRALLVTPMSGIPTCDTFFKPPMDTVPSGMVDGAMLSFIAEIGHFRPNSIFFVRNL